MKPLIFILFLFFSFSPFSFAELERLDPHGTKDMDLKSVKLRDMSLTQHPECKVCHQMKEKKMVLNSSIPDRCALCHNRYPHSGVIEHKGRATCIECHRPHRALLEKPSAPALPQTPIEPSFHIDKPALILPEGLIEKKNPNAMIRKQCRECHPWK